MPVAAGWGLQVDRVVFWWCVQTHGITSYPWVTSFYKGKKVEDMAGLGGWVRPLALVPCPPLLIFVVTRKCSLVNASE